MSTRLPHELRPVRRESERAGWSWLPTRKGHWKVRRPDGGLAATLAGTPGDSRGARNALADLRRNECPGT